MSTDGTPPVLLALDWGTSSLRGFLMSGDGRVLEQRDSPHGIVNLPEAGVAGFEAAFAALCGAWIQRFPGLPVVAGGMVGSAQGWREAAYADCPADARRLAAGAVEVGTASGARILIAPGLVYRPPGAAPDVMRGEEIQISGALLADPGLAAQSLLVMPGTHSKWVEVASGRITAFATFMTGELFALLCRHSLLGRLMTDEAAAPDVAEAAFARGVALARESQGCGLTQHLFATRSLGLTGALPGAALKDFLSGLLIGHEVAAGAAHAPPPGAPLAMIGEPALCRRYAAVMRSFGLAPAAQLGNTAPAGLFHFAVAAGLVAPPAGAQETTPP